MFSQNTFLFFHIIFVPRLLCRGCVTFSRLKHALRQKNGLRTSRPRSIHALLGTWPRSRFRFSLALKVFLSALLFSSAAAFLVAAAFAASAAADTAAAVFGIATVAAAVAEVGDTCVGPDAGILSSWSCGRGVSRPGTGMPRKAKAEA